MNNGKKRVTYRPNKASGVVLSVLGMLFVLIGIFLAIPHFGFFGVIWTFAAVIFVVVGLYQAFGKRSDVFSSEVIIEDIAQNGTRATPDGGDIETRLSKLQDLYDRRVISREEYEEKRRRILEEI